MDIYSLPGSKVKFINKNGYDYQLVTARSILETDHVYEIEYTDVGSFSTHVKLKGIVPLFNSVMFENIEGE